ncbi:MAG: RdgB/HAM1 family non-canonical purine NTP pyrophosphatase [Opitutales bacterium]
MIQLLLATNNTHKVGEIAGLMARLQPSVSVGSAQWAGGMPQVDETAGTFIGNAQLKAQALRMFAPPEAWVLADDSGLAVDALDGAPGVYSSRYAGSDATDAENMAKLLEALAGVPVNRRTARFVCVLALIGPSGVEAQFEGTVEGTILEEPRGKLGFGYDPVFAPTGYDRSFAELGPDIKDQFSHRARALEQLAAWIDERF